MIINFGCSETEKIFTGAGSRKLPVNIQNVSRRKLRMLNNAIQLQDLGTYLLQTGWKNWKATGKDSIAFVSIINGVFAFFGTTDKLNKLRLLIIINCKLKCQCG